MFVLSCALQGQKGGDMTSFCSVVMGGLCGKTNDPKINLNRKKKPMGQLVCYSSNHDATAGVYFYLLEGGINVMRWIAVLRSESLSMCVQQQKTARAAVWYGAGGGRRERDGEGEGRSVGGLRNAEREGTSA